METKMGGTQFLAGQVNLAQLFTITNLTKLPTARIRCYNRDPGAHNVPLSQVNGGEKKQTLELTTLPRC